jgi:phosphoribosyl 1,2-cyclic phosphodiesterase
MRVRFWGVRGTIASPGPKTLRYGGNTSCVAVESEGGELIVLDAGSGFCPLGDYLMQGPFGRGQGDMTLLLSHTHLDHLIGFPFAVPVHIPGNRFTIYGPAASRGGLEGLHEGLVAPAYSPVYTLDNIGSTLDFRSIPRVPFQIGTVHAQAQRFPHGAGYDSWGFKLTEGDRTLAYVPDVEYPRGEVAPEAIEFVRAVNLLIHGAHYTPTDYKPDLGHGHIMHAVRLAETAGVDRLILFHHAPKRSDEEIDALLADHRDELRRQGASLRLDAAYEGMTIQL